MFWIVGIAVAVGVGLWSVLMGHFGRKQDSFSTLLVMRISYSVFFITMLTTGLFPWSDIVQIVKTQSLMLGTAALLTIFSIITRIYSYKHMPIGIVTTISGAFFIISIFIYELLFLTTLPTPVQLFLVTLIFAGTASLGAIRNHTTFELSKISAQGLFAAVVTGSLTGLSFVIVADVARENNPAISAVLCQLYVGALILIALLIRWKLKNKGFQKMDRASFLGIVAASTIGIGVTVGFAYGATLGPVTILAGLEAASIVFTALLSWLFVKENLSFKQWIAIVFVTLCIIVLRLYG